MVALAVAAVAVCVAGLTRAERFDYGRLLVEEGPGKGLKIEDNVRWLEEGKVPDYAVANVIKWLSLKGVDVAKSHARYRTYGFLDRMYAELLPNFPEATAINIGCDEVWDIIDPDSCPACARSVLWSEVARPEPAPCLGKVSVGKTGKET